MKSILALALLAGAPALAQDVTGTGTWLWTVTTDDGDTIVEPGESAKIKLTLLTEPDDPSYISTLSFAVFDTLGDDNAYKGQITDWKVLNSLAELTGDLTTTDGVSLYNTSAGQLAGLYLFQSDNPIDVLEFTWTTEEFTGYDVGYTTFSTDYNGVEEHIVGAWVTPGDWYKANATIFDAIEADITFSVANACYADFDKSGHIDILDYIAFQLAWHADDMAADCNGDASLNILDFVCFHTEWHFGCI